MEGNWTPIIAAIATIFGGIGVEVIRKVLSRAGSKETFETTLRNEIRGDLQDLKQELKETKEELDEWKAKAYTLMSEAVTAKGEIERLKTRVEQLEDHQQEPAHPPNAPEG